MKYSFTQHYDTLVNQLTSTCGVMADGDMEDGAERACAKVTAIWDTGTRITTISRQLAELLNLPEYKGGKIMHVGGESEYFTHFIDLILPDDVAIPHLKVMDGNLPTYTILIGMDVIGMGDFAVSNHNGKTAMSFRIPSENVIDFRNNISKTNWIKRIFNK